MKRETLKSIIKVIIRESIDNETVYAEYISQMRDEVPFMMGGKKFEYVWAKYPSGKEDIGVYAFSGDVVYGYQHFRKMYNITEDNRYNGGVYLPQALRENNQETFVKEIDGTVGVSDIDYDYSAKVTVTVVSTREPHGEVTDEIMPISKDDIDIRKIVPEPNEALYAEVAKAIRYNIRENIPDFLNESDMEKQPDPIQSAKDWILDCANSSKEEEDIKEWLEDASDDKVKKYVNRTFDGGWNGFLDTL